MSSLKSISLEVSSRGYLIFPTHTGNMVLNPSTKYVHLLLYLVISKKGKDMIYFYQLFLLCLPISSLTMVAFFPAVFGDREVCFKSTSK